jgi:hypothetical protein
LESVDKWRGMPAVSGDLSDHRPSDPAGVVVTLSAKHTIGHSPMAFRLDHPLYDVDLSGVRTMSDADVVMQAHGFQWDESRGEYVHNLTGVSV